MAHPGGRPSKYKKIYAKKLLKFFNRERIRIILEKYYYKNGDEKEKEIEVPEELPTKTGFCMSIKVDPNTFDRWVKAHKEFRGAWETAKKIQEEFWLQNSIRGLYPPQFTIFMGKNVFGWKDKTETDLTSKGKQIVGFNYITPDGRSNPNNKTRT